MYKIFSLPCCHSMFDVPQQSAVDLINGVQVREEQGQKVLGDRLLFANLVSEPLR